MQNNKFTRGQVRALRFSYGVYRVTAGMLIEELKMVQRFTRNDYLNINVHWIVEYVCM